MVAHGWKISLFVFPKELYAYLGSGRAEPGILAFLQTHVPNPRAGVPRHERLVRKLSSNTRKDSNLRGNTMNQKLMWTIGAGGLLLVGATALVMTMAEPTRGRVLIAGDKPVTEDQVRQKLQSEGWSNIQIARDGRYLEATGSKDGQTNKMEVDSQTGRLRAGDDDDDDDE